MFAGRDVAGFDEFDGAFPVVAEAEFAGGLFHFGFAPGELALADGEDLFGGVGDHFGAQRGGEGVAADGVADDGFGVIFGDAGEVFTEEIAVAGEGGVEGFVRLGEPPGEEGIVVVVEGVPVFEGALELGGGGGGAEGLGGGGLGTFGLWLREPLDHFTGLFVGLGDAGGGVAGVEGVDAFAGFAEVDDGRGEGEERGDFGDTGAALGGGVEALVEEEAEGEVFGAAVEGEGLEGDLIEGAAPGGVELFLGGERSGGDGEGVEAAEGGFVGGVVAEEGGEVGCSGREEFGEGRRRVGRGGGAVSGEGLGLGEGGGGDSEEEKGGGGAHGFL